jgi:hypothetical protein
MCHGFHVTQDRLREEIARELLEEEAAAEAGDETPSFLNEERETDVELLTDGGT